MNFSNSRFVVAVLLMTTPLFAGVEMDLVTKNASGTVTDQTKL